MKLLRKLISRLILTEGAASPQDLIKHIQQDGWKIQMYTGPSEIHIGLLMPIEDPRMDSWMGSDPDTWGEEKGFGVDTDRKTGISSWSSAEIGVIMVQGRHASPSKCWELVWAVAPAGFGPLLADLCLELAGENGLVVDRDWVSPHAANLFTFYWENRQDVTKQLADDAEQPFLTPDDISDDIHHIETGNRDMTQVEKEKTKKQWEYTASGAGDTNIRSPEMTGDSFELGYGTKYYNEPQNWIYRKPNKTVLKALKKYITKVNTKFVAI